MKLIQRIKRKYKVFRVNRALGIELYDWQIDYIFDDAYRGEVFYNGRYAGKTTAGVLRLLLNPKFNHADLCIPSPGFPVQSSEYFRECAHVAYIFGEDGVSSTRRLNFLNILRETRRKLNRAHIKTNSIVIKLY